MTVPLCQACHGSLEEHEDDCPEGTNERPMRDEHVEVLHIPMRDDRDVVALRPAQDSPEGRKAVVVENVVATLRELLVRAEAGELQGLIIAMVRTGGDVACRWTEHQGTANMLAAVTMAQHRYARHVDETAEEEREAEEP